MTTPEDELHTEAELLRQLTSEMHSDVIAPIQKHLPLARWGYRLSWIGDPIRDAPWHSPLIYDSPRCRVALDPQIDYRARLDGVRQPTDFYVLYGRSHAPNEALWIGEWKEKRCRAWHDITRLPFAHFFEGTTPQSLRDSYMREDFSKLSRNEAQDAFNRSAPSETLGPAERDLAYHGFLWEHYGERLFSLFDLRRQDQWDELRKYLREYFKRVPYADTRPRRVKRKSVKPWEVCLRMSSIGRRSEG